MTPKRSLAATLCALLVACPSCALLGPEPPGGNRVVIGTASVSALLALPEGYDSLKTYPLLVALHGNGGTAESFAPEFSSLWRDSLLVAVPQGEYEGPAGGRSWFFLTSDRTLWERYDTRTVSHVVELVAAIGDRYPVGEVFVLGFSQGASLAYMIGLRNPARVAGVLAIGGVLPEIDEPGSIVHAQHVADARNVRVFVARGTSDAAVGRDAFVSQRDFLLANGYSVTACEYSGGHWLTDDLLARVRRWLKSPRRRRPRRGPGKTPA